MRPNPAAGMAGTAKLPCPNMNVEGNFRVIPAENTSD